MTREEVMTMCDILDLPYEDLSKDETYKEGYDGIYIWDRKAYDEKKKHPRKKDLFVPYLRVSNFLVDRVYIRENGWTEWTSYDELKKKIKKLV